MSETRETCVSTDKNQNKFLLKKIYRKQLRSLSILSKHENIDIKECESRQSSKFLLISNAGLICEVSYEELFDMLSFYGQIKDIVLIPQKPYVLIEFNEEFEAINALNFLNQNICHQLDRQLNVAFITQSVWDQVLAQNKQIIESYCCSFEEKPKGLILIQHFISEEEENSLLLLTKHLFEDIEDKSRMKNRLVKHFGFEFNYLTNKIISDKPIEAIPREYNFLLKRLIQRQLIDELPDQLTINYYSPGQGIPSHTDTHSICENCIICVSIGSDVVMQFTNPDDYRQSNVFLPKRSVLLMRDESRYLWRHSISSSKSDLMVSEVNKNRLTLSHRKTRISLTFRKVKTNECNCDFDRYCDSRNKSEISEQKANHLESEYVHKVYETIASHFSETRYKPWPKVSEFLNSLEKGSLVLDVGCGNGKYLNINPNILIIGCDRSEQLLTICRQKANEVFLSDCLQLSVRNAFNACISIAVLHHLSSHQRRVKAFQSIIDLLTINGKALVYVWAFEQNKNGTDSQYLKKRQIFDNQIEDQNEFNLCVHQNGTQFQSQELLVPWKTSNERQLRYYHVFREGELKTLLDCLKNIKILDIYYDSGNWATILQKI